MPNTMGRAPALDSFRRRYGPWCVVAGGSEGLGAAFAEALAERGLDLLLVARRPGPLDELAGRLRTTHGVNVETLGLDLGAPDAAAAIASAAQSLDVGLLICSAATSQLGPFLDLPLDDKLRALDVNCRTPLCLAHLFGLRMRMRGRGGIVFMSSLAGIYGGPYVATYAASKAFSCLLAESLAGELGPLGIDVLACVAGPTRTPTYRRSFGEALHPMEPRRVVAATLAALGRRPRIIPGLFNRATTWLLGQLPRAWVIRLVGDRTRRHLRAG